MTRIRFAILAFMVLAAVPGIAQAQNPTQQQNDAWRQRGPCRDPWINMVFYALESRSPRGAGDAGECDPALYGAAWSAYPQLYALVGDYLKALAARGLFMEFVRDASRATGKVSSQVALFSKPDNQPVGFIHIAPNGDVIAHGGEKIFAQIGGKEVVAGASNLVSGKGGNVVSTDGAGIVAAGGGNIVAAGGGNIVAAGGGNIVAAGGGNFGPRQYRLSQEPKRLTSILVLR